jgi:MarR family transcriptional regulator, organic hydroperoxide resistance regulator
MSASLLHEYIERISQLLRSETRQAGADYDLQPIQLSALQFLSRSNRYSNTPQGVTERKGFIQKSPDKKDGRMVHLNVTKRGLKLLGDTLPAQTVVRAWEDVPETEQNQLTDGLQQLLQRMQQLNGMKPFGLCRTCHYNSKKGEGKFFCELTQENLSKTDVTLICREYLRPVEA